MKRVKACSNQVDGSKLLLCHRAQDKDLNSEALGRLAESLLIQQHSFSLCLSASSLSFPLALTLPFLSLSPSVPEMKRYRIHTVMDK